MEKNSVKMDSDIIQFTVGDKEITARVLLTTHLDEFNKDYVIFVMENEEISAAVYEKDENSSEGYLSDIETDEEWKELGEVLDSYFDALEDNESEEE